MAGNTGIGKMHMDLYTNNAALTQKAKFWCNFVSSLKDKEALIAMDEAKAKFPRASETLFRYVRPVDVTLTDLLYDTDTRPIQRAQQRARNNDYYAKPSSQDLRVPDERYYRSIHPSIVHTLPDDFPELKSEFSKLESQMFDKPRKRASEPLTPILPDAHDRIFTPGYNYMPVHTEIYGMYRPRAVRMW